MGTGSTGEVAAMSGNKRRAALRKATATYVEFSQEELADILSPIIDILQLKVVSIELEVTIVEKFALWKAKKPDVLDIDAMEQYDQEGLHLHQRLEEAAEWSSFTSKANPHQWRLASDYSERMVSSVVGEFNYYFVCKAGGVNNICWTMINSKNWTQFFEDPIADKQRWYCKVCRARYKTGFGVLIEIVQKDTVKYMMADYPPDSIGDVRAAAMEREHSNASTPAELFAAVPNLVPAGKLLLRLVEEGVYGITSPDELLSCGTFKWAQMFNLKPTKAQQRAINNAAWYPQQAPRIATITEVACGTLEEC
jgi:hypothetical protein